MKIAPLIVVRGISVLSLCLWLSAVEARDSYFNSEMPPHPDSRYSRFLSEMNERPIRALDEDSDFVFRCLYLPAYQHPICVRLEHKKNGQGFLYGKEADGKGGFEPGKVFLSRTVPMAPEAFKQFTDKLRQIDFFHQPTVWVDEIKPGMPKHLILGGSRCILEANDRNRWHALDRMSETYDKKGARDLATLIFKQAGLLPSQGIK